MNNNTTQTDNKALTNALSNMENDFWRPHWTNKALNAILSAHDPKDWHLFEGEICHLISILSDEITELKEDFNKLWKISGGRG